MSGMKKINEYHKAVEPKVYAINNQRDMAIMQEEVNTKKRIADETALEKAAAIQERTKQRRLVAAAVSNTSSSVVTNSHESRATEIQRVINEAARDDDDDEDPWFQLSHEYKTSHTERPANWRAIVENTNTYGFQSTLRNFMVSLKLLIL